MLRRAARATALIPIVLVGCRGLLDLDDKMYTEDEAGGGDASAAVGSPTSGAGSSSGSAQSSGGAVACAGDPDSCKNAVPVGWTRVGYAGSQASPCAPGFATLDILVDPAALPDACQCEGCSITAQPDCSSGPIQIEYGSSPNCGIGDTKFSNNKPGGCNADISFLLGSYIRGTPPPPTGGACSLTPVVSGIVSSTEARVCVPQGEGCESELCADDAPLAECIQAEGAKDCPDDVFHHRHLVGSGASITCSACGCDVEATCTGTMALYSEKDCTGSKTTVPVNGECVMATASIPHGYQYTGAIETMRCTPTVASTPTITIDDMRTLCCKE